MSHTSRIILLIDMDCFYCQVEENLDPNLKGKPLAVVQYNQWRGGGIIAVNYAARDKGVTRHMRGDDAKKACPEIVLVKVPEVRGKAGLSKYRDAGKKVAEVLGTFTPFLERASVDEAYLDITNVVEKRIQENNDQITVEKLANTFVVGNSTPDFVKNVTRHKTYDEANFKLALGGVVAEEIREEVFKLTGYRCSAGIAHNKILAKLVCGLHKPNKQTILPHEAVPELYKNMSIKKIKSLGGKFGDTVLEKLNIETMAELAQFNQRELAKKFDEKSACWLFNIARGIDIEPVNTRLVSKSIGCCKKFPGKTALRRTEDIEHWLGELAEEMFERLEEDLKENGRKARQMVVSFTQEIADEEVNSSKSHPLNSYEKKRIFENALKIVQKNCLKNDGTYRVTFLGISVGQFQDIKKIKEITSFFKNMRDKIIKRSDIGNTSIVKNNSEIPATDEAETTCNVGHEAKKIDDNAEDTSNTSVFSRTTEESDMDSAENLIFYHQVHPDTITNQDFICSNEIDSNDCDTSLDSISNEINVASKVNVEHKTDNVTPVNSFFSKYFGGSVNNRDFNTSKFFDIISKDHSNNDIDNYMIDQEVSNVSSEIVNIDKQSEDHEEHDNIKIDNDCPHCGKTIKSIEYQSHMDYHFAVNLVKSEAHLYKNEPLVQTQSSSPVKSYKKRTNKELAASSCRPILDYFHNTEGLIEDKDGKETNVCDECNKHITLSEWDVHTDYHAAKKLHLAINVDGHNKLAKRKIVKSKFKGQKDIIGFLKSS